MKQDIITIVARQLQEAQDESAYAKRVVDRIQITLNRKNVLLAKAGERLIDIEEIFNSLPK